jgi:hypothetical protein
MTIFKTLQIPSAEGGVRHPAELIAKGNSVLERKAAIENIDGRIEIA